MPDCDKALERDDQASSKGELGTVEISNPGFQEILE